MTNTTTAARYIARPFTFPYATAPAYWYVHDTGTTGPSAGGMVGGRFDTPEAAQADADERNAAAAPAPRPVIELDERPTVELDDELTDEQYDLADRIVPALESEAPAGLTPSAIARKVRATTSEVYVVLGWLVAHRMVHTSGNGAWKRYHAGRA